MSVLAAVRHLLWKDLVLELRTREILATMTLFALLVAVVFHFAFSPGPADAARLLPGMLWVTLAFASTLGLSRSFVLERDQQCLEALRLFPVDPGLIYAGKFASNLLYLLAVEALLLPALGGIAGVPLRPALGPLGAVLLLGSVGLVAVGTVFSAVSVHTGMREVLLPILLLPLASPVLINGARVTAGILSGRPWADLLPGVRLLIAFDVIFVVVGYLIFEYVVEE
ncbi:MAG: heme exporter protein CcmB [Armatimonadota bacterium]|nr:heme exporter protein CcmB [Armatimonadota bacterium]MDR7451446.1 heme exporter protein CcmB [Armatimonadota bacterium]MDR7466404.1 heme exporter protein CcmB [Armatimonadota bacterium]MDR7493126.1 heme exporter protein CcmB [Armatimonadota bacterium]MDR7498117.1 heme exporter protein CcmB [Armatimonadota bacterium]